MRGRFHSHYRAGAFGGGGAGAAGLPGLGGSGGTAEAGVRLESEPHPQTAAMTTAANTHVIPRRIIRSLGG